MEIAALCIAIIGLLITGLKIYFDWVNEKENIQIVYSKGGLQMHNKSMVFGMKLTLSNKSNYAITIEEIQLITNRDDKTGFNPSLLLYDIYLPIRIMAKDCISTFLLDEDELKVISEKRIIAKCKTVTGKYYYSNEVEFSVEDVFKAKAQLDVINN
jgi:hypothetical protein